MKTLNVFLLSIVVLVLGACAHRRGADMSRPAVDIVKSQQIEPQARTLFFQAERLYNARNFDEAKKVYGQVRTRYPKGRAAMVSSYRTGTIHYYQENYAAATKEFEGFLTRYPASDLAFDVNYNLAAAEFQQGNHEKAFQLLSRFRLSDIQAQGPRRAEVIYALTAQSAAALNNHPAAVTALAHQLQLPVDESSRSSATETIDQHLGKISNRAELDRLLAEVTEPVTRGKITARMTALANSETVQLVEGTTPPPVAIEGDQGLGSASRAEKMHIGVILPLSGKFASYGRKALDGILLAAGTYKSIQNADLRLFIEDSASSPAQAQQAVDTLYYQHKVIAIIGPLNYKESIAVADRAQQLGVANLTLSGKEGISEKGAYLFQNALTPRVQMESLLAHCTKEKGMKRFAILAPNDSFGKDMSTQFWDMAEKYGGKVVAYQSYPPDETDFQAYIQDIVGMGNPKFRKMEAAQLANYISQQKKKTGKDLKAARLPPIIDFDAIFIPDSPKNLASIAASLAYFDVTNVPLLGTAEWNTDQLYKRGGKYVEGAMFPGGVSTNTRNPRQQNFIRVFSDAYGQQPDLLAGQAYEAMELIEAALLRSSNNRNDLVSELVNMKEMQSPLGGVSFDNNRTAKRALPVYAIGYNGAIIEQ